MKRDKKKIIKGISFFLIIILFISGIVWSIPEPTVEPDNPILKEASVLQVDFSTQSGAREMEEEDEIQTGDEQEDKEEQKNKEDNNPKEEQEQSEKSQEETEEDKQEQTKEEKKPDQENDDVSEDMEPDPEDGQETNSDGKGESGENSDQVPGQDENGEIPEESGDESQDQPGTGEEPGQDEQGLVTDLYSRIITFSELEEDTIYFYAYYSDADVDANIKVNYKHEDDSGNGKWLSVKGEHDYETKLKLGKNYITIYYTDENGDRNWARIVLTYQADKADANKPEVGENPPTIETNLDDWEDDIKTNEFTFVVSAKTWKGKRIYSDSIQVKLDGEIVTNPTGSGIYEYVLRFNRPNTGDYENHTVSVLAWDSEGNSRYLEYKIRYHFHNEGEKLGTVKVVIDATTVECGIVDEGTVEVNAGDTAAKVVVKMLEDYGYSYRCTGSVESNFYLSSISRADAFRGCHIGDRLRALLERDGITFTSPGSRDKLGEFDFTRGSGWLYFINGELCPGKAMSAWILNGGETITIRYTLAYGKDVGSTSEVEGALSNYCAKWVNGQVIELGHDFVESDRVEPEAAQDGYIEYTCTRCGETKRDVLPATGEEPETPDPPGGEESETPDPPGGEEPGTPDPPGGEESETPDPSGGEEPENPDPSGGEEPVNPEPSGGEGVEETPLSVEGENAA